VELENIQTHARRTVQTTAVAALAVVALPYPVLLVESGLALALCKKRSDG
jgi:hypothetical protein